MKDNNTWRSAIIAFAALSMTGLMLAVASVMTGGNIGGSFAALIFVLAGVAIRGITAEVLLRQYVRREDDTLDDTGRPVHHAAPSQLG